MSSELSPIEITDLSSVSGGNANANVDIKLDGNELVRDVGTGAGRLLGCATGAESLREFGNCILTGKLDEKPPATQAPTK